MPAQSETQENVFKIAIAAKKDHAPKTKNPAVTRIAQTLSAEKIKEFTKTK